MISLIGLIQKGRLRDVANAIPATFATDKSQAPVKVARLATVAVANAPDQAANDFARDPDRWCWPHGSAMNTAEIDTFMGRLARFSDKGLTLADAEPLADRLVIRDREQDDRQLCLECIHLQGGIGRWRCGNAVAAGVGLGAGDGQIPNDLALQQQRCDGFTNYHSQGTNL